MFYVIYNSATKQYLTNETTGTFGPYEEAAQFSYSDAHIVMNHEDGCRVVGPCRVGEEP